MRRPTKPCVLIVEDDEATRDVVVQVLQDEGYHTLVAGDGAAALAILDREGDSQIDLILLDLWMPVMDGWQFVAAFRAQPRKHVPIVLLTAEGSAQAAAHADEMKASGFVVKPFEIDALMATVRRHTSSGSAGYTQRATGRGNTSPSHETSHSSGGDRPLPDRECAAPPTGETGLHLLSRNTGSLVDGTAGMTRVPEGMILSATQLPSTGSGGKTQRRTLGRHRLHWMQRELVRVQKEIAQVAVEVRRMVDRESTGELTLVERRTASKLRMEHERLRWELEMLRQEFFTLRDSQSPPRRSN